MQLRPYQDAAVNDIRVSFRCGKMRPLLCMPTGAGKTVVFTYISGRIRQKRKRALILVHRIELLRQTGAALSKFGIPFGYIQAKYTADHTQPIQVASVQTLVRRLAQYPRDHFDLIVVDEAHHATAGSWSSVIEHFTNARVLGVTATPVRTDGKGLGIQAGGIFDDLIMGPSVQELINLGYLCEPRVMSIPSELDLSAVRTQMGDYKKDQLAAAVDKPTITGDAVSHYEQKTPGRPAVAFCVNVSHAQHVAEQFRARGWRAYAVDGTMDDQTRTSILSGLSDGRVQIVTSCNLISEGTDIPAIETAILLRPTQSLALYLQQVGRALRPVPGKSHALILDHVGNVFNHGLPHEARDWSLQGREKRSRRSADNETNVPINACEKCYATWMRSEGNVCPSCGHQVLVEKKELQEQAGELVEVNQAEVDARRRKRQEVGQAKSLQDLQAIEQSRGYKSGWARHVWNARVQAIAKREAKRNK